MDSFSWSDAVRACVPCMAQPKQDGDEQQQQQDGGRTSLSARAELERLLDADDDPDAETLSLHSNIGVRDRSRRGQRRPKAPAKKTISMFGFNLFGRPKAGIALPDSDDEGDGQPQRRHTRSTTSSALSDTADPDAAPLADSAIANLSRAQEMWEPEVTEEDLLREEAAQREREERRAARRMRKDMKKAAAALAAGVGEDGFEGFPGSGAYLPNAMPDLRHQSGDDFGDFVHANNGGSATSQSRSYSSSQPTDAAAEAADVDEADFGGETYAAKRKNSSHRSNGGSDTRSGSSDGRRKARSGTSATSSALAPPTPPPHGLSPSLVPLPHSPGFAPSPSPRSAEFLAVATPVETGFPSTGFGHSAAGGGFPSAGLARPKDRPRTLSAQSFRDALAN